MKISRENSSLTARMYRDNRSYSALQTTIISVVALGATVLVGLTGFVV